MEPNLEILAAFILATAALAAAPGPDNIFVLTQSLSHGKSRGLATTAGLMTGCLVHTTLLAFGVSAVIQNNEWIFQAIKVFGACYLFYLAFMVWRNPATLVIKGGDTPSRSLGQLYRQGFIMNVLNPKVTVFFFAFFPGFLFSNTMNTIVQFYILGLLFMIVSFSVFAMIAILAGAISEFMNRYTLVGHLLKWLQILVFTGIGLYLLLS